MRNESILFASDLDNTLLFSHKHAQAGDVCVEYLDGKAQGFFTPKVIRGLAQINRTMRFVPVTSRSIAQFLRIQFPPGCVPKYALVANGGLLLRNGAVDPAWQARSLALVAPWRGELAKAGELLAQVPLPLRARMVDDLYLFAPDRNIIDVFKIKYDYHNAKAILKAAAVGTSPERMLMDMGRVPAGGSSTSSRRG